MAGLLILNKTNNSSKIKTNAEQEKALRDALHTEIENKSKACSNRTYDCTIPRLVGFDYCIRHILQDPRAPYKQCAFLYQNNKKCVQAAPKNDAKKGLSLTNYCFEHSRLVQLTKTRNSIGKYKQIDSNEALLNELSHHLDIDKNQPLVAKNDTDEEIVDVVTSNVEPFINYNFVNDFDTITQIVRGKKRILDYASDSSSDGEVPTLSNTAKAYEWDTSDDESLDSGEDDVLKHSIIYTTEEATMITKQKMVKLQKLYIGQIDRLHYLLKEKKRKYLQSLRKERETLCRIHDQPKETPQERHLYEKLKALNHYHRRYGVEAVLYKKFKEKRIKSADGYVQKGPHGHVKCIYTEGGVKCGEKVIPCCKYCRKHILEDKKQCLFRACAIEKSGVICQDPVPNIFDDATCVLHISLPNNQKVYTQKKYESETEEDEDEITMDTVKIEPLSDKEEIVVTMDAISAEDEGKIDMGIDQILNTNSISENKTTSQIVNNESIMSDSKELSTPDSNDLNTPDTNELNTPDSNELNKRDSNNEVNTPDPNNDLNTHAEIKEVVTACEEIIDETKDIFTSEIQNESIEKNMHNSITLLKDDKKEDASNNQILTLNSFKNDSDKKTLINNELVFQLVTTGQSDSNS